MEVERVGDAAAFLRRAFARGARCRAGCCTPLLVWTSVHRMDRSCALKNGGKLVGTIHRICLAVL